MFDYNNIIKRAIEYFPAWTDIRKRYKKSKGGKFIQATGSEILSIETEIQKYIDMYFLDRYEGKENKILAFTYKTNLGIIDPEKITSFIYNDKKLKLTDDINEFINNENCIYYENGYLHITEYSYSGNNILKIYFDDNWSNYTLYKHHVWNIFDEFACFVGLERHQDETNESLVNRILYRTQNMPNATEIGLKNSIISELMDKTDISEDDIIIEKLTPESLRKQYDEFNSLLDFLSDKNRDVYKDKRWDLDLWQYDFKSIEYIDYKWDETLKEYTNGVGFDDDLNVIMSNASKKTDANITLYKKSEEKLTEYVHNKNIEKNIRFTLKKYNNILNSKKIQYKVNASPAIDITNDPIEMSIYENELRKEKRTLDELYKIGSGISIIDRSKITDLNKYRLEFFPLNDISMQISKCKVIYKNKYTNEIEEVKDLISPAAGFIINGDGVLVNTSIKKQVRKVSEFNITNNLSDGKNGVEILNNGSYGKGIVSVSGLGLMQLNYETDYNLVNVPRNNISINSYCYFNDNNEIVMRHDVPQTKVADINIKANTLSFKVSSKNNIDIMVQDEIFGFSSHSISNGSIFKVEESDKPRNIKIKISGVNISSSTTISEIQYSSHEINFSLEKGELLMTNDKKYILPGMRENSLIVEMKSYSGLSPVLKRIYIGSDIENVIYKTEIIPSRNNCDRILEVSSNCKTDLVQVNGNGAELKRTENYEPSNGYKAIADDAWIRLNLSEYSSVEKVYSTIGKVEIIEESGVKYYNIKLKNGDIASNVIIEGIRTIEAKKITLTDMIKFYIPDYNKIRDKVYCSMLSEGLIVEKNDPDNPRFILTKISDKIFSGMSASKYIIKKPDTINAIFCYGNQKEYDNEHIGAFDYVSFYPASAKIHTSLNEFNMFTNESRNIRFTNSFNPPLQEYDLYMYTAETYMITGFNVDIRFCDISDQNIPFENLYKFSLGKKNIAIKTDFDLSNSINYEVQSYDISEDILLSRYVPIKKEYEIDNNFTIYTDRFIVEPPNNMSVEYKYFDGSEENEYLIKSEQIIIENDGFNKLEYSNIDKITYISLSPYSGEDEIVLTDYTLLKDEGIIIWTNNELIEKSAKVYIRYTVKEAISLMYSTDALYKAIDYTVDAYDELKKYTINDMYENSKYDLRNLKEYAESDLVHVLCLDPSFEAILFDNMLKFKKTAEENTIMIKTGFYYINGKEYYLFSEDQSKELENRNYIEYYNVDRSGGELYLYKATDNYVRNSEMLLKGMNGLYRFDCSKKLTYGISNFFKFTACDSYNGWNTFEMNIKLDEGLNDTCLNFEPRVENGYAFIEITEYLSDISKISFWADEELTVSIGIEDISKLNFSESLNINIDRNIIYEGESIREETIVKEKNKKYYLIITGKGKLDDIIINDASKNITHEKNINILGLNIKEKKEEGSVFKMSIDGNKYSINNGASFDREDKIRISSNINWGITKIKAYDKLEDFNNCIMHNLIINNDYVSTANSEGQIESDSIYIDNPLTIKRLFFKVNDINFENMNGMKVTILSSNNSLGPFLPIMTLNKNIGYVYGDYLNKYIKIRIDIPANKIINNFSLFAEYKSEKANAPKINIASTGELISKVFDTQENLNYRIKAININDISNINNVLISVRSSKDKYSSDVWMDWKELKIDNNNKLLNTITFDESRFFQIKVKIIGKESYIKLDSIDLEVI